MENLIGQISFLLTVILTSIFIPTISIPSEHVALACKISCLAKTSSGNASDGTAVNNTNPLYNTSSIKSRATIGMINYNTTTLPQASNTTTLPQASNTTTIPQASNGTYNNSLTAGNNITTNSTGNLSQALLSVDGTHDEGGSRDKH